MLTRKLTRRITQAITRPITQAAVGGGAITSLSSAKLAIEDDAGDVNLLFLGDSTGDATNEWIYLFAQWLATEYPTHSVSYRLWGSTAYGAATSISTGSGANTIRIWNGSVAGSAPIHHMGSTFAAAITATTPDLIIWSHGHNLLAQTGLARAEFVGPMDQVRIALPNVPHAAVRQNPRRDDNNMAPTIADLDELAADYGDLTLIDAYSLFIAQGKAGSLYADNIHPNAAGSLLFLQAAQAAWGASRAGDSPAVTAAFLESLGTNLLANADFSDPSYLGGTPSGWSVTGDTTCTLETTIVDAGKSQCMKVTSTAASSGLQQNIATPSALFGKSATLAVRMYVPSGQTQVAAGCNLTRLTPVGSYTISRGNVATDGWRWFVVGTTDLGASFGSFRVTLNTIAAAAASTVYIDRAILVEGNFPRDAV